MSEAPEKAGAPSGWKRVGEIFAKIFIYGLLALVLLITLGIFQWPLEFGFHLIAGPFIHAWKNLPPFFSQWRSALLPLTCLVIAIVLGHRFIIWWIHAKGINLIWRWKHTAAAASLLLLGSAAAIAMSGITHQAAWLASSPWLEYNRSTHHTVAINNARQIMFAVFEYEIEHGKYPDTLEDTAALYEQLPRMLWVKTGSHNIREPFIYLKPGRTSSDLAEPVLISPLIQPYDKVVVGYSDGSVRTITLEAWQKLAKEIQAAHE